MKHTISEEDQKTLREFIERWKKSFYVEDSIAAVLKITSDIGFVVKILAENLLNDKQEDHISRSDKMVEEQESTTKSSNDEEEEVFANIRKNSITLELPEKYEDDFQKAYANFINWTVTSSHPQFEKGWVSNAPFLEVWKEWLEEKKHKGM